MFDMCHSGRYVYIFDEFQKTISLITRHLKMNKSSLDSKNVISIYLLQFDLVQLMLVCAKQKGKTVDRHRQIDIYPASKLKYNIKYNEKNTTLSEYFKNLVEKV